MKRKLFELLSQYAQFRKKFKELIKVWYSEIPQIIFSPLVLSYQLTNSPSKKGKFNVKLNSVRFVLYSKIGMPLIFKLKNFYLTPSLLISRDVKLVAAVNLIKKRSFCGPKTELRLFLSTNCTK